MLLCAISMLRFEGIYKEKEASFTLMVSEEEFPNELSDPSSSLYKETQESVIKTVSDYGCFGDTSGALN